MSGESRDRVLADIAALRAAAGTGVLMSWELVVILVPLLDLLERLLTTEVADGD